MSRPSDDTSLAVVDAVGMWRNRNRSRARPSRGENTSTDRMKASPTGRWLAAHQQVEDEGGHEGLGAEGQVEHPGGPEREHQAHRHEGEVAPVGDAGNGVAQEVAHGPPGPFAFTGSAIPAEGQVPEGPGVPGHGHRRGAVQVRST